MELRFRQFVENNLALVPTVTKKGIIRTIDRNKNPIMIQLSDGTRLYFSWDEFRRVKKEPEVGKTMTVVLQRHHLDNREEPSQIHTCVVE